jgi:23S rRNA (cytosine1962-C5)-methyltransferase
VKEVRLRKKIDSVIRQGHPWIWRDALEEIHADAGEVLTVVAGRGDFLARGLAEDGPIGIRVFTLQDEPVDQSLLRRRISEAATLRTRVVPPDTNAYRLLNGEGDRVPGIVCDIYGEHATVQLDGAAALAWRETILAVLDDVLVSRGVNSVLLRTGKRGERRVDVVRGKEPPPLIEVQEHGMVLLADLVHGQKTGLFLDHRESRRRVRELSRGLRVLNLYGYTGGFSVAAALGGATSVTTVDIAKDAIKLAEQTFARNVGDSIPHRGIAEDVPNFLRAAKQRGERYDLIVSDPPSFAPNEESVPAALNSYRTLHQAALRLLAPGGLFIAASCSSHVDRDAFEKTLENAAPSAGQVMQILERDGAPADHPRLAAFPEGDYLKVLLARLVA